MCSSTAALSSEHESFFRYEGCRWLWNEEEQLRKRYRSFNVEALKQAAANAVGAKSCTSMVKAGEGNSSKAFRMTMDDGRAVIAKVPNPNAGPAGRTTASEVATMELVSGNTIAWAANSNASNFTATNIANKF